MKQEHLDFLAKILGVIILFMIVGAALLIITSPKNEMLNNQYQSNNNYVTSTNENPDCALEKYRVRDTSYEENARVEAKKALDYCKINPSGTYSYTVYNGYGCGIPFNLVC